MCKAQIALNTQDRKNSRLHKLPFIFTIFFAISTEISFQLPAQFSLPYHLNNTTMNELTQNHLCNELSKSHLLKQISITAIPPWRRWGKRKVTSSSRHRLQKSRPMMQVPMIDLQYISKVSIPWNASTSSEIHESRREKRGSGIIIDPHIGICSQAQPMQGAYPHSKLGVPVVPLIILGQFV